MYKQIISNKNKNKNLLYGLIKICIIICIIICIVILIYRIYRIHFFKPFIKQIENFANPNYKTLISNWDNGSGFFSELLFKLNHYLYCKKYKINFKTNSDNWSYKYANGWIDYFEDIILDYNTLLPNTNVEGNTDANTDRNKGTLYIGDNNEIKTVSGCCEILEQFPLRDYVAIISEYYKYNTKTFEHIQKIKNELGLVPQQYGAIYIRRGDKLVDEIKFIPSSKFVELLLSKYPDCKIIFVQTDDYNSFLEVQDYIQNKNLDIKILTLCPKTNFGSIANSGYANKMINNSIDKLKEGSEILSDNKEYMKKITQKLSKPISEMTPDERYEHTLELLTSVDISINSKICVCDYKSNVSRFIKIAHNNFNNVFDVTGADSLITLDSYKCPAFDFDSIHNNNK